MVDLVNSRAALESAPERRTLARFRLSPGRSSGIVIPILAARRDMLPPVGLSSRTWRCCRVVLMCSNATVAGGLGRGWKAELKTETLISRRLIRVVVE